MRLRSNRELCGSSCETSNFTASTSSFDFKNESDLGPVATAVALKTDSKLMKL